jgi:hypothetical protein
MRNASDKCCREIQDTHVTFNNFFFFENHTFYETMWKNFVQSGRPQMTIWYMRIACWVPRATNTHSEYVILIAFPLQRSLHERASMLRYTHISCLVTTSFVIYCWLETLAVVYVYLWTLIALLNKLQRKLTTVWSTSSCQTISKLSGIKHADFNSEISVSASTHTHTHTHTHARARARARGVVGFVGCLVIF